MPKKISHRKESNKFAVHAICLLKVDGWKLFYNQVWIIVLLFLSFTCYKLAFSCRQLNWFKSLYFSNFSCITNKFLNYSYIRRKKNISRFLAINHYVTSNDTLAVAVNIEKFENSIEKIVLTYYPMHLSVFPAIEEIWHLVHINRYIFTLNSDTQVLFITGSVIEKAFLPHHGFLTLKPKKLKFFTLHETVQNLWSTTLILHLTFSNHWRIMKSFIINQNLNRYQ